MGLGIEKSNGTKRTVEPLDTEINSNSYEPDGDSSRVDVLDNEASDNQC